jgi:hypothetical protein
LKVNKRGLKVSFYITPKKKTLLDSIRSYDFQMNEVNSEQNNKLFLLFFLIIEINCFLLYSNISNML